MYGVVQMNPVCRASRLLCRSASNVSAENFVLRGSIGSVANAAPMGNPLFEKINTCKSFILKTLIYVVVCMF